MRSSSSVLLALAALSLAGSALPDTGVLPKQSPRRAGRDRLRERRYLGLTEEQRLHNQAIDAKREAKKAIRARTPE